MIFADKPTIGELSREEAESLKGLTPVEKAKKEHELFRGHLGRMVGISHMKDTSQDYLTERSKLALAWENLGKESNVLSKAFGLAKERFQEQWQGLKEKLDTARGQDLAQKQGIERELSQSRGRGIGR